MQQVSERVEKATQLGMLIANQIQEMFNEDSHFHISISDIEKDANVFFYALACIAPAIVFDELTTEKVNSLLEFNHLANKFCFEFMEKKPQQEEND